MKILVSNIDANPHRDLVRNPVSEDQIVKLVESINRTGFWDNLVVRPSTEKAGRYQLAYGHNRLAACVRAGIVDVDLPVRELADYDMLCCMIDENNTQQSITPKVVFENVTAALILAERLLLSTENVEQFNELMKSSIRSDRNASTFWNAQKYSQARIAIADEGDGLGKDFISHFMPTPPKDETLQSVIDSYYADRRKAAADRREVEAKERARMANEDRWRLEAEAATERELELQAKRERDEADRKQREAFDAANRAAQDKNEAARLVAIEEEKAQRKAKEAADAEIKKSAVAQEKLTKAANKKAKEAADHSEKAAKEKAKSERMDFAGVDRVLLEQLDSTTKMNDVVKLIKKNRIPKEFHAALIKEAENWTVDGSCSDQVRPNSVSIKGYAWWDEKSGEKARRYADMERRAKHEAMQKKWGSTPFENTVFNFAEKLRETNSASLADLLRCSEHFEFLNSERLHKLQSVLTNIRNGHNSSMDALLGQINDLLKPVEKDITPTLPVLEYHQQESLDESV